MRYLDDVKNTAQTNAANGTQKADTTSVASKSSTPVPVGQKGEEDKLTQLIKSEEFRALSNEEKLKKLKEIMPDASEESLKATLNEINSTIAAEKPQTASESADTSAMTPEEKTALEYAEKLGENATLDDVLAAIKAKDPKSLTEAEKTILKFFESDKKNNNKDFKNKIGEYADLLDNLIPKEVINSEAWKQKSPMEKLNARFDALLGTIVPGYEQMPQEAKANIRNQFIEKLGNTISPEWQKLKDNPAKKNQILQSVALMIEITEKSNITIKELLTMPEQKRKELIMGGAIDFIDQNFVNNSDIDVTTEDWKNKTADEQLNAIFAEIISKIDPTIDKNSEEFKKIQAEWLNSIGSKMFGDKWQDKNQRAALIMNLANQLSAVRYAGQTGNGNVSISEFMKSARCKARIMNNYESKLKIEISDQERLYRNFMEEFDTQPTNTTLKPYLQKQEQELLAKGKENLSKREQDRLTAIQKELKRIEYVENQIKDACKHNKHAAMNNRIVDPSATIGYIIQHNPKYNGDCKKYLTEYCSNLEPPKKIEELTDKEKRAILSSMGNAEMMLRMGAALGYKDMDDISAQFGFVDYIHYSSNIKNHHDQTKFNAGAANSNENQDIRHAARRATTYNIKKGNISNSEAAEAISHTMGGKYGEENSYEFGNLLNEFEIKKEDISDINKQIWNKEDVPKENKQILTESIIEHAPDDDTRTYYSNDWSNNVKDPDMLEALGAASKYVEDSGKRSQYNSYVTNAAKNYPPETQTKIRHAIETGKTSHETSATSSRPSSPVVNEPRVNPTTAPTPTVIPAAPTAASTTTPASTPVTTTAKAPNPNKPAVTSTTSPVNDNVNVDNVNRQTTEALQQKKDTVLDKIEDLQEHIAVEQAAREITDEAIEEFADTIQELEVVEDPSKINTEKIKKFINSNSISLIYSKLIEKFGPSIIHSLISAVVYSGNSSKIDALAAIIKDGKLLEELFAKSQNKRLLDKLQPTTIKKFIPMMSDLSVVRSDIMYEFIMDLINSNASIDEIKKYLHYLPFGMQANICETYNNLKGVQLDSNFALKPNRKNKQETTQKAEDKTQVQTPKKEEKEEPKTQPAIKPNELTAMRNDGVQIKRKETFAGISDQYEEDAYEVVDDKTGKTQAQREAILTPGSFEWNIKYNKQAPATAFTMAALDEEDEDGIGMFGSNKVGMKQPIKKKYKPQDFRFNA